MKTIISYFLTLCLCFVVFISCSESQDFSQFDDINLTPTVEGSILFVESTEDFINLATGSEFLAEEFNFDAFTEDFFAERVRTGVITYEVENTTSKDMELIIELLDVNDAILDSEAFIVNAAPSALEQREIAYGGATGRDINIIRNTSAIRVTGRNFGDNLSISPLPSPKLIFRSSGQFTVAVR